MKLYKLIDSLMQLTVPKKAGEVVYCYRISSFVRLYSLAVMLLFAFVTLFAFVMFSNSYYGWWLLIIFFSLTLLGVCSHPVALVFTLNELQLHSVAKVIRIPYTSINTVHHLYDNYSLHYVYPIVSSLGFMGYNGRYYDFRARRHITMHTTERSNMVVLECLGSKNYIISAENYDVLILKIKEKVNSKKQEIEKVLADYNSK